MRQFLLRFIRHERGVALIEFIIVFPFMFLFLFGGVELARYILIIQRVEKAAYVLTDITAQYNTPTPSAANSELDVAELTNNVFPQFHRIMGLYGDTTREAVIMTSVAKYNGNVRLRWQRYIRGSNVPGLTSIVSGIGPENTPSSALITCSVMPFNAQINPLLATMLNGENMIIGEVSFRYRPIVAALLGVTGTTQAYTGGGPFSVPEQTITRRLFLHPRNGDLLTLPPAHPAPGSSC